jgi:hypothetical protein
MKDKPPPTKPDEQTPFERFRETTQRLLQVDKKELPKAKHKRRRKKGN